MARDQSDAPVLDRSRGAGAGRTHVTKTQMISQAVIFDGRNRGSSVVKDAGFPIETFGNDDLKDKKVLVVGLGKSGVAAANLLVKKKARVTVADQSLGKNLKSFAKELPSS